MNVFPAIDLKDGKVVRLLRGDYGKVTVFGDNPLEIAKKFEADGAKYLHVVDLDGAKDGNNPNFEAVKEIAQGTGMFVEIGGGIRSEEIIEKYLSAGVSRVILGTVAVTDFEFTKRVTAKYGDKIAVGVDAKDGMVAICGWTKITDESLLDFCKKMECIGVKTVICTDIAKDGAMQGCSVEIYETLKNETNMNIVASGGVSSYEDIKRLAGLGIYGAIVGKAIYTGDVDLKKAILLGSEKQ